MAPTEIRPQISRVHLKSDGLAPGRNTRFVDLFPHPDARLPPEDVRITLPGGWVDRPGYLPALRHGACPLIVEDNRAVLLMPQEDKGRKVAVFRWHLANQLLATPFQPAGPTGGWAAAVLPWPFHMSHMARMGLPGPASGIERLIFLYRVYCAERDLGIVLAKWIGCITNAKESVEALIAAIEEDGSHQGGEPWPNLRALLSQGSSSLGLVYARYRDTYESVARAPVAKSESWTAFWSWCQAGAPTGRYWLGWSGRLLADDGPIAKGPLAAPFTVVWCPDWGLPAASLTTMAAGAYLAQFAEHTPVLTPEQISTDRLKHQNRWLTATAEAARAIIERGIPKMIEEVSGGRKGGEGILQAWLVHAAAKLDPPLTVGDLAKSLRIAGLDGPSHAAVKSRLRLAAEYWSKQRAEPIPTSWNIA